MNDASPPARRWLVPALLVLSALVLRTGVVLADSGYVPYHDAFDYDRHARSIAAGDGYPPSQYVRDGGPTGLRAPAYPYFLGGVYALSGDSWVAGRLANAALGALAVLLLLLTAEAIWGRRVGLVVAGLAAVFPPLVLLSRDLLSESLFIVLLLGAVLCVFTFRRSRAVRWAAAAGALCGLAALTRSVGFALLIPLLLGVWVVRPRLRLRALAAPATATLCTALVVAPWTIRNAAEFGRFIPVTTGTGFTMAGTYNQASFRDDADPAAWRSPVIAPGYAHLFHTPGVDEATLDSTLRREASSFAWQHPAYVAQATGENLLRLFYLTGGAVIGLGNRPVNQRGIGSGSSPLEHVGLAVAVALALVGVFAIVRSERQADAEPGRRRIPCGPLFLWLIPIFLILAAAPFNGLPRYRLPADPFLLILAAIGVVWAWDRLVARTRATSARATAATLSAFTLIALGGCGGGSGGSGTNGDQPSAAVAKAPSKQHYVARADAICGQLKREATRLGRRLSGDATPEHLLPAAIRILAREARRLRALPLPAEGPAPFRLYVRLFDPIEELVRQRAHATVAGNISAVHELDSLIAGLATEQRTAARLAGLHGCSVDFGQVFLSAGKPH